MEHRDRLLREPGLIRYFTFEKIDPTGTIANLAAREGALSYHVQKEKGTAAEPLTVVDGQWPGKKAVRLDQGFLTAPAFALGNKGFSLEGWFRVNGPGVHRGVSGVTNGALLSLGNGYWEGWRLTTTYPEMSYRFEIGRPQPSHAEGLNTRPVADRIWHHLAATWDGRQMRIYVDGRLAAFAPLAGKFTPPDSKQAFRIGFANSGVGSVVLDVDEVAIFDRAIDAGDVLRHACPLATVSPAVAARIHAAGDAILANQSAAAEAELQAVLQTPGLQTDLRATVLLQLADVLNSQRKFAATGRKMDELLRDPDLSPRHIQAAGSVLLRILREAPGTPLPQDIQPRILALAELTPIERTAARLNMGHAALASGDYAAARAEFGRVAADRDAPPALRSVAQLHMAESYVCQKDFTAAKSEYAKVAQMPDVPPHYRWEAEQRMAQLDRIKVGLPPRDPAAGRIQLAEPPPPVLSLWVAADGADTNPGTRQQPFATLERARDEVRHAKQAGMLARGGATVYVRGGRYPVTRTFKLAAEDSGTEQAPIVYAACDGETPQFSGGVRITGFRPVSDRAILDRLPAESRAQIVQVDLKALGITHLLPLRQGGYGRKPMPAMELFCDGRAMELPRWPAEGFVHIDDICVPDGHLAHGLAGSKTGRFRYAGDLPALWTQETELLFYGYWCWDWADSYQRVEAIDREKHEITLAKPEHNYGYRKGQRYYALNVLCEMRKPGQWYLDHATAMLYFYPPCDLSRADVELSTMESAFVQLDAVEHVRFQGLVWEFGCGDGIVLHGGGNCRLAGCTVRHCAGTGVEIQGGHAHGLLSCDIYSMGRGGTRLSGGDRKTLAPSEHFVENCHIYELSRIDHTYTPAVGLSGVGAHIAHNLMHDIASSALNVAGNEHLVELNEVYHVVQESDDQGGVDMFGDPTYRGNVYRYNYWHHIGNWDRRNEELPCGEAGIRLDDAISGTVIYGNVFCRCSAGRHGFGGVQIHGGKDNFVDNNIFADCRCAISFSPWQEPRWREYTAKFVSPPGIDRALYLARYPALARLTEDPNVNTICRNLVFRCGDFLRTNRGNLLWDNRVTDDDPGFVDARHGNFQCSDAPAGDRMPLAPIPFAEIGLYRDAFRKQLPEVPVNTVRATPPAM
jgi:hypothetical protein